MNLAFSDSKASLVPPPHSMDEETRAVECDLMAVTELGLISLIRLLLSTPGRPHLLGLGFSSVPSDEK